MKFRVWKIALAGASLAAPSFAATPVAEVKKSAVRIAVTMQEPNYRVPWTPGQVGGGVGAGFVIDHQRVMTNAHVVSNARFVTVEKENDPKKYIATVEHVAHDCDLAVLKFADTSFFKNTVPLTIGDLPEIESQVSVYGYPIGGEHLSVTRGIISRVDFQPYAHSAADSHLAIQIDAAINPGNSGGPVMQAGKVVGVAFQGYSGDVANSVGYMIPTPVVKRFLKDIEDGHYDRYMDLSVTTFNLQNPAMRRALGLKDDDDRGVFVSAVASVGSCAGLLKVGDVLLGIDGLAIASDAFVDFEGERVHMAEVVERKFKGDDVKLDVWRDKKEMSVTVKLASAWSYLMQANIYDVQPTYVLIGGLIFQPLSRNFLQSNQIDDLRVRFFYDYFLVDELYREHPQVIVLSQILPDPINTYLAPYKNGIVDAVNGVKIRTLKELSEALAKEKDEYVITLVGVGRPLVLARKAIDEARERIRARYNVLKDQNLEENDASEKTP